MNFSDGSTVGWHATDSGGSYVNSWTVTDQIWHLRTVDLSTWAGKSVSAVYVGVDNQSQTGAWWELIADAVIAHNDGTLVPLYNGQGSFSFGGPTVGPGMSGVSYLDRHLQNIGHTTVTTTYYYHGDQIGSSRLMTSPFGEPVWNATYLPYGEEYNPEITVNNRKFTGKEHDTESGLDYFGARYYSSLLGRFISSDPKLVSKQRMLDPQQWNMYGYVRNNPMIHIDPDGRELKIIIVNSSSFNDSVARQVGDRIAASARSAGVKNVTVEVSHSPTLSAIRSELSAHVHSIEYGPNGGSVDVQGNAKDPNAAGVTVNRDVLGNGHGYSGVDTNKTGNDVEQMANAGKHELGHDAGNPDHDNSDSSDVMNGRNNLSGKQEFTPEEAQKMKDTYNRPGEVEKSEEASAQKKKDRLK